MVNNGRKEAFWESIKNITKKANPTQSDVETLISYCGEYKEMDLNKKEIIKLSVRIKDFNERIKNSNSVSKKILKSLEKLNVEIKNLSGTNNNKIHSLKRKIDRAFSCFKPGKTKE